jgi:hypothetical protein
MVKFFERYAAEIFVLVALTAVFVWVLILASGKKPARPAPVQQQWDAEIDRK